MVPKIFQMCIYLCLIDNLPNQNIENHVHTYTLIKLKNIVCLSHHYIWFLGDIIEFSIITQFFYQTLASIKDSDFSGI